MLWYAVRRLGQAVLTILGVATVVFLVSRLSGDPAVLLVPPDAGEAEVAAVRASLGLDQPLAAQYVQFISNLVHGDFGPSIRHSGDALDIVLARLPATISLGVTSFVIGMVLAFVIGLAAQLTRRSWIRSALLWLTLVREAIPIFWFGLILVVVFSVWLGWFPAIGSQSWRHYVLPSITLATMQLALYVRLFNAAFGNASQQDYVRTAVAKGVRHRRLVLQHMLPNALLPIVTVAGVNFGVLLTGTVVTEKVFSWPGVGRLIVDAVLQRDYPVVQAGIVVVATIFVMVNLAVDLLYAVIDPRIKLN